MLENRTCQHEKKAVQSCVQLVGELITTVDISLLSRWSCGCFGEQCVEVCQKQFFALDIEAMDDDTLVAMSDAGIKPEASTTKAG